MVAEAVIAVVQIALLLGLAHSARRTWTSDRARTHATLRAVRGWMIPTAVFGIAVTAGLSVLLLQVPILRYGWLSLFGGSGSIVTGGGWTISPLNSVLAVLLVTLLSVAVPREAREEEELFRAGNHNRRLGSRALRALAFGAMHLAMGIPLAIGLAMTIPGALYDVTYEMALRRSLAKRPVTTAAVRRHLGDEQAREYQRAIDLVAERAGVDASCAIHTVWNYLILSVLAAGAAFLVAAKT